jgi:hypothetical protein
LILDSSLSSLWNGAKGASTIFFPVVLVLEAKTEVEVMILESLFLLLEDDEGEDGSDDMPRPTRAGAVSKADISPNTSPLVEDPKFLLLMFACLGDDTMDDSFKNDDVEPPPFLLEPLLTFLTPSREKPLVLPFLPALLFLVVRCINFDIFFK